MRLQRHLRHSGDAGQGLATETHGAQREKVGGLAYLAGGVALEGQARVGLTHALAVVHHHDAGASGLLHQQVDVTGTGVHGVLHQFLHHGRGTLDDLACSYLVGDRIGQKMDEIGHKPKGI